MRDGRSMAGSVAAPAMGRVVLEVGGQCSDSSVGSGSIASGGHPATGQTEVYSPL
jgi:hypothetical protein